MTGRDLIMYILSNNLEDEPIFKDGTFIGFMTVNETAVKMDVGVATIYMWILQGRLKHIRIGNSYFVPVGCELISEGIDE